MLHINIFSVTFMTSMIIPKMVEKRKGAIVNIGSASCFGFPLLTVYAATKAYVDSFSKNLAAEYDDKGELDCGPQSTPNKQITRVVGL